MVNRVLTSPYLWWFDPHPAGLESAIGGLNECWRDTYGHDRIIPRAPGRWKRGKRTLAFFAGHRTAGTLPASQTIDNAVVRRAPASPARIRGPGSRQAHRRFWPLSDRQGRR